MCVLLGVVWNGRCVKFLLMRVFLLTKAFSPRSSYGISCWLSRKGSWLMMLCLFFFWKGMNLVPSLHAQMAECAPVLHMATSMLVPLMYA